MAAFSHETLPDAEQRAVEAGRGLILRMKPTGSLVETPSNIIGVSINTGPAMTGYVGGEQRVEFNAIGDTVNVAYHMLEYARSFRILAGAETVAALGETCPHVFFRTIYLRGRESPVDIHEIQTEQS
jgi:adenylate cyclase